MSARARTILPDQPILGFGDTKSQAVWDASESFIRSLSKLSDEERASIATERFPTDARLIGAATGEEHTDTGDEAKARDWAADKRSDIKREGP